MTTISSRYLPRQCDAEYGIAWLPWKGRLGSITLTLANVDVVAKILAKIHQASLHDTACDVVMNVDAECISLDHATPSCSKNSWS